MAAPDQGPVAGQRRGPGVPADEHEERYDSPVEPRLRDLLGAATLTVVLVALVAALVIAGMPS